MTTSRSHQTASFERLSRSAGDSATRSGEEQHSDGRASATSASELNALMARVADGDEPSFAQLYDAIVSRVFGLVLRLLRNSAQAEEVTQEVMVEVWRTASRFDPARGSAISWFLTLAHRRAVDRVRSSQASTDREQRLAAVNTERAYDQVDEAVMNLMDRQELRRCLEGLTEVQKQALALAYYRGHTYREVARILDAPLPTVKTRMRAGLLRLRDCLGVA